MAVYHFTVKKDQVFMSRYICLTKPSCESPSPGICAAAGLVSWLFSVSWVMREQHCAQAPQRGVAVEMSLAQFFLHPCGLFGWDGIITSTGDKTLSITEPDLSQYKPKINTASSSKKTKNARISSLLDLCGWIYTGNGLWVQTTAVKEKQMWPCCSYSSPPFSEQQ